MEERRILEGKRILMIATAFFGYELRMKRAVEELGGVVTFYDERCIRDAFSRAILKIHPAVFRGRTKRYYTRIIEENKGRSFDYVFVYGATMIDAEIVGMLRAAFSGRFILYLADSVLHNRRYERMFPLFDTVATFDRLDYEHYRKSCGNFVFRPLFFSDEYRFRGGNEALRYDICFIGTIHSDRMAFIDRVREQAEAMGLATYCYPYLQSRFMFWFYKLTKKSFRRKHAADFRYDRLEAAQVSRIVLQSKALLDAQFPKNAGLTMRTIEALGMNRKLITANADIRNYDFYDPDNILVVDREDPKIDPAFFRSAYRPLPGEVYESYAIASWVRDLFCPS